MTGLKLQCELPVCDSNIFLFHEIACWIARSEISRPEMERLFAKSRDGESLCFCCLGLNGFNDDAEVCSLRRLECHKASVTSGLSPSKNPEALSIYVHPGFAN